MSGCRSSLETEGRTPTSNNNNNNNIIIPFVKKATVTITTIVCMILRPSASFAVIRRSALHPCHSCSYHAAATTATRYPAILPAQPYPPHLWHSTTARSMTISPETITNDNTISTTSMSTSTNATTASDSQPSLPQNLVVVIAGCTGVGKSDVAATLCRDHNGMIVSADSVQAYKGVEIGANKPTPEERKITPHILIDVADHTENYNAAEWRQDSIMAIEALSGIAAAQENDDDNPRRSQLSETIQQFRQQQNWTTQEPLLPVVCGGTMMYLQWLVHGRPDAMKPTDSAVAKATSFIEQCQQEKDYAKATAHVSSLGDVFAERVSILCGEDWYRLRRILEVAYTAMEGDTNDKEKQEEMFRKLYTGIRQGGLDTLGYDVRCFFLCPDDRMNHTRVVDQRCEQMLMRGLVKETADLQLNGIFPEMATKAIGYRQTLDYLNRDDTSNDEAAAFDAYIDDFTTATRRYAKKQMAWFRKDKDFCFVPVPLLQSKTDRVAVTAQEVMRLIAMSRDDYEAELSSPKSQSAQTKKRNEAQGKTMKFYKFQRHLLTKGSAELERALQEAIECSNRMRSKRKKLDGVAESN